MWNISACGLNCAKCDLLKTGECGGCRGPRENHWTPGCHFLSCAVEKGHQYCFECKSFVCEKLNIFAVDGHDHHRITVENMKRMKEIGLEAWILEQPEVMFCPGWLI